MSQSQSSRRQFLHLAGAAGAACLLPLPAGTAQSGKAPLVRQSIAEFVKEPKRLASLRAGVQAMQDLGPKHPFSWTFQANIHWQPHFPEFLVKLANEPGASPVLRLFRDDPNFKPEQPVFNQCPHGNWWFLPWHRAYLYFFERVLRWAAKDEHLALPYWNYSRPDQRGLPDAFLEEKLPGNKRNPLYLPLDTSDEKIVDPQGKTWTMPLRNGAFALSLTQLTDRATRLDALGKVQFTRPGGTSTDVFGGAPADELTDHTGAGALEALPQNIIHDAVGGDPIEVAGRQHSGFMADVASAARDPIFWLHHANVDRLWETWLKLGDGRRNPSNKDNPLDKKWLDMAFHFYDVTADGKPKAVTLTVEELLRLDLGYVYDDTSAPGKDLLTRWHVPAASTRKLTFASVGDSARTPGRDEELVLKNTAGASVVVPLVERAEPVRLHKTLGGTPDRRKGDLLLAVEGITFAGLPAGTYYEVYLGLPAGQAPDPTGPYFAGALTFFGLQHDHGAGHGHRAPLTVKLNVSQTVNSLLEKKLLDRAELKVTFVPQNGTEPVKKGGTARPARARQVAAIKQVRFLLGE